VSLSLFTSDPFTYPGGGIAAGVPVAVYFSATSVRAPIFHDDLGTTPRANPVRTDDFGRISFWIEPGSYVLSANHVRIPITVVPIPDPPGPQDYVTRTEVESMIAAAGGSSLPPVTAKGQLYAATAAASVGLLSAGTNGQVLSADSVAATGLRWIDPASGGGSVTSVFGRSGVVTAQSGDYTAAQVGLGNVDNTSDVNKPISTATATALAGKQTADADLTTIAGLTATTDNFLQAKASAWASRTPAQVAADLQGLVTIGEAQVTNLTTDLAAKQPLDADLTTIAGLTATTDNIIMAVASAWASRTPAQVKAALAIVQADVAGLTAALALLAPLASPALTGTATAVNLTASGRLMISPDTIAIAAGNADTDASLGNFFKIAANANFTLTNPTNPTDGQRVTWQITQDATGSRTITLGSAFALGTDITSVVLTTAINKCDFLGAIYDSTAAKWRVVSFVKGY
jgi:hypothetical protein